MSHFLLPSRGSAEPAADRDARYGDDAMLLMLGELRRLGISPNQCQGKVFGGGNMFPDRALAGAINVGQKNGEAALDLLNHYGVPIVSESLFGIGHRQVIFDVSNGDVWCHQVPPGLGSLHAEGDLV
jgi:chemotaxis protein CheD